MPVAGLVLLTAQRYHEQRAGLDIRSSEQGVNLALVDDPRAVVGFEGQLLVVGQQPAKSQCLTV